jgi:hypothetical protein
MKLFGSRKSDERGIGHQATLIGLTVLVVGVIGFAGWRLQNGGLKAKAAGYTLVQNAGEVSIGACKIPQSESVNQIGLKIVNNNSTVARIETRVYGSGAVIRAFNAAADTTTYPTRYTTSQSTIVVAANNQASSISVSILQTCP